MMMGWLDVEFIFNMKNISDDEINGCKDFYDSTRCLIAPKFFTRLSSLVLGKIFSAARHCCACDLNEGLKLENKKKNWFNFFFSSFKHFYWFYFIFTPFCLYFCSSDKFFVCFSFLYVQKDGNYLQGNNLVNSKYFYSTFTAIYCVAERKSQKNTK